MIGPLFFVSLACAVCATAGCILTRWLDSRKINKAMYEIKAVQLHIELLRDNIDFSDAMAEYESSLQMRHDADTMGYGRESLPPLRRKPQQMDQASQLEQCNWALRSLNEASITLLKTSLYK